MVYDKHVQFITVGNYGYIKFLKNLILNFQQSYMKDHKLLVFCLGEKCLEEVNSFVSHYKCENIKLELKEFSNDSHMSFFQNGWVEVNNLKFLIVMDTLKRFDIVHYVDGDVVFLQNPENCYNEYKEYDLVFQSDSTSSSIYSPVQCAGNF